MKQSLEYADYTEKPTIENASELISETISQNLDLFAEKENYIEYLALRPRAEKVFDHGLFSASNEELDLKSIKQEVASHQGNIWTHVISLHREDAVRLGYNNADAWKALIKSKQEIIANSMRIPLQDMIWYAAFHNESHHPHVHLVVYSTSPTPAYLNKNGIEKMRSHFANEIFKQELTQLYNEKTMARDTLTQESKDRISSIISDIKSHSNTSRELENKLIELSKKLQSYTGRKVYAYLPPELKALVNDIVTQLAKDSRVNTLYEEWGKLQNQIVGTYKSNFETLPPLADNDTFKRIKNAVITESLKIDIENDFFEELHTDEKLFDNIEQNAAKIESFTPPDKVEYRMEQSKEYKSFYDLGKDSVADTAKATEYYRIALENFLKIEAANADDKLWYRIGIMYQKGLGTAVNIDQAKYFLQKSAEAGNNDAQTAYARIVINDENATRKDANMAIQYLEKAALNENIPAQYMLGKLYLNGHNFIIQNDQKTIEWLSKVASEDGILTEFAEYSLGKIYCKPDSIFYDLKKAIDYFTKSAERGNPYAQYELGKYYLNCEQPDVEKAIEWLTKSAEQGNQFAKNLLDYMTSQHYPPASIGAVNLLYHLSRIIQSRCEEIHKNKFVHADSKLMKKIMDKKSAQGMKIGGE